VPRVLITRPIPEAGVALLRAAGATITYVQPEPHTPVDREELAARIGSADVLISLLTEAVDGEILEAGPRLRGVANYAVGIDNVDLTAAGRLGIPVSNTPGVLTEATADLTWALLLALARRVPEADRFTREGRFRIWDPELLVGADVGPGASGRRKVLGIVGFGRIGRAVARRAAGFDMEVLVSQRQPGPERETLAPGIEVRFASLDEVVESCDFLSLHAPLTPDTRHLVDERRLRRMKPTAFLINTARGPLVDEDALVRALREDRIAGAALDVFEHEPELAAGLAGLDNVVLAPHVGSATRNTRDRMSVIAGTNALHHLRGEPAPDVVNPEVYASEAWSDRRSRI